MHFTSLGAHFTSIHFDSEPIKTRKKIIIVELLIDEVDVLLVNHLSVNRCLPIIGYCIKRKTKKNKIDMNIAHIGSLIQAAPIYLPFHEHQTITRT